MLIINEFQNIYIKMSKAVKIIITTVGADTGPYFDIYTDADCYEKPLAVNVEKTNFEDPENPYVLLDVPDSATRVRVQSKGTCVNSVDIVITQA